MSEPTTLDDFIVNKGQGGEWERVPEGTFIARCYQLMTIGTQTVVFKGETKLQKKVIIGWELLDDEAKMSDGKPFVISKTYTHTLNERGNLYADLNAWRGKKFTAEELEGFDLRKILGAYCQIQVLHTESDSGKTYANVNTILPYKGDKPAAINENIMFSIGNPDIAVFNALPDFLKRRIEFSQEWDGDAMVKLGAVPAKDNNASTAITPNRHKEDVVIQDMDEPSTTSQINTDDIPF